MIVKTPTHFLSEFYSDDKKRKATLYMDKYHYVVNLYEDNELKKVELLTDKSIHFAEDLAENFVMYVGAFKDNSWIR